MATAKKLPSGNYRVRVHVGDRKYKSFTAKTKKGAEYMAAEYLATVNRSDDDITVGEAMHRYIASRENALSPTTLYDYRKMRRLYLADLMDIPLSNLTQEIVQKAFNKESKTHAVKTVKNIRGFFNASVGMFLPVRWKITLPQETKKEMFIPAEETIKKIFQTAYGTSAELPFLLASQLGLRMSEVLGLKQDDVGDNFISIKRARVHDGEKMVEKTPKSYSGTRTIPCSKYIIERIQLQKHDGYIVNETSWNLEKIWQSTLKKAGVPHFNFHALRHYFASQALLQGIPPKYVSEMMGHASEDMINKVYQHTFEREKLSFGAAMVKKSDSLFENV